MRNTILLLLLFLLLGGGSWWYFNQTDSKSSYDTSDRKFAEEPANIHKIFIADRSGETTTLTRSAEYWLYRGKHRANPNAMENLLDAIRRVEVNYIPAKAAVPNIVRDLASNGIKVELYDKQDQLIKAFYVGGMTNDELGTYMIMEGAEQPYVTHIPSWEGGLRARFQLKGLQWRDKSVFSADVDAIQSLSVEYPKQKNKSFRLERQDDQFAVSPYYDITPTRSSLPQQGRIEAYLVGFKSLKAEAFENGNPRRDSVKLFIPFCTISLQDIKGKQTKASFYPIMQRMADGALLTDDQVLGSNTAIERYFVDRNDGEDFMLVQQRVFQQVFWPYDAFFE